MAIYVLLTLFAALSWIFSVTAIGVSLYSYRMNYLLLTEYTNARLAEAEMKIKQEAMEEILEILRQDLPLANGPTKPMSFANFNNIGKQ